MAFKQVNPNNNLEEIKQNLKLFAGVIAFVVVASGVMGSFYTVEPDEEAVVLRFGKHLTTNGSGLHFKVPFIDRVIKVQTQRVLQEEFGFRTANSSGIRTRYSSQSFDDESLMLTGDLNVADVEWVVQYRISDPFKYLFKTKERTKNIRDVSESIMRRVVGDRSVTEVLTTGRVDIEIQAKKLIQEVLDKYDMGVRLDTVALQDVNPPESVKASFNEVNEAKQEQEQLINQAEKNYNEVIPKAKGEADKLISESEGYAEELINISKGDAEKFEAILLEYKKAPTITKKRIYIETMEEIYESIEDITVVDPKVKGLLPVFQKKN